MKIIYALSLLAFLPLAAMEYRGPLFKKSALPKTPGLPQVTLSIKNNLNKNFVLMANTRLTKRIPAGGKASVKLKLTTIPYTGEMKELRVKEWTMGTAIASLVDVDDNKHYQLKINMVRGLSALTNEWTNTVTASLSGQSNSTIHLISQAIFNKPTPSAEQTIGYVISLELNGNNLQNSIIDIQASSK
jgi:hypothetical protein